MLSLNCSLVTGDCPCSCSFGLHGKKLKKFDISDLRTSSLVQYAWLPELWPPLLSANVKLLSWLWYRHKYYCSFQCNMGKKCGIIRPAIFCMQVEEVIIVLQSHTLCRRLRYANFMAKIGTIFLLIVRHA